MDDSNLPQIDSCIVLYTDAYDLFGTAEFGLEELARRITDRELDDHTVDDAELSRNLNLLVAYGLLERTDDRRYCVRCFPDEDVDRWHDHLRSQFEAIHERVRTERPPGAEGTEQLRQDGRSYARIEITEETTVGNSWTEVSNVVDPDDPCVALCAPATSSSHVQQLADELCDSAEDRDRNVGPFEKVSSDVVGEHKDDLEYRAFLTERTDGR